jgi:hypothetical protein
MRFGRQRIFLTRAVLLCGLITFQAPVHAAVYTLRDGVGGTDLETSLRPKEVLSDKISINGHIATLTISQVSLRFNDALKALRPLLKGAPAGNGSILFEKKHANGSRDRYYIVSMGEEYVTMMFTMHLPAGVVDKDLAPRWPKSLPAPRSGAIEQVMEFPDRNMVYGSFRSSAPPSVVRRNYDSVLTGDGWKEMTLEDKTGGVYYKEKRLMVVSAVQGRRSTLATVYVKTLKEAPGNLVPRKK